MRYPHELRLFEVQVKDGPGFRGIAVAYNTRTREGVDEALALAERAGARIVKPAQDVFWGGYCVAREKPFQAARWT